MEEGSLRCDANISIRPKGETKLGTKTELKNMNTFRGVEKALAYEALRQRDAATSGEAIVQQTFRWDPDQNRTVVMRSKEEAHDYRYFPDPDLLPLVVDDAWIRRAAETMPELPARKRARFIADFGVTPYMADVLTLEAAIAKYFEETLAFCKDAKLVANWVMGEVLRFAKEKKISVASLSVTPQRLGALLGLVTQGALSANAAKRVFDIMETQDKDAAAVVAEQGLTQISDTGELSKIVKDVVAKNPKEAQRYKAGETKLVGFFVGQVMKATSGKGNPKEINKLVSELLGQG
jgi:aspartyl-tRNA(Asn)/glutamyl-tRNA(Gln) amidotransferase subunit B